MPIHVILFSLDTIILKYFLILNDSYLPEYYVHYGLLIF